MEKDETMTIDHDHLDGQNCHGHKSWSENNWLQALFFFLVAFVFVTLFSRSTSFLYVFEGADPAIFKQMGQALLKGKTLYVDYFDNKGCILYFIQALGLWIGGDFFILIMQALSLTVTLVIWDKMLILYRKKRKERIICLGIALVMLLCFYGAGDQTQEWCLPLISYPLLIYFQALKEKKEILWYKMFLIGLCCGIITFIQINNACVLLGFVIYIWILYFLEKNYRKFFSSLLCFVSGWLIPVVICILYFYLKAGWHGVHEMIYASFLSNFEYIDVQKFRSWMYWIPYSLFLLSLLIIQILNYHKDKNILIPTLISFGLFVGTFGKQCNSFYLMAILPLCIVTMMTIDNKKRINSCLFGINVICMIIIGGMTIFHFINDLILQKEKEIAIYDDFHQCIEKIPIVERDSIFNYNLFWHGYGMMQHEQLIQCNWISLGYDMPALMKKECLKHTNFPKWIIISPNRKYYQSDAYYILNNYELIHSFIYDRLYFNKPKIGQKFEVCLYRRKEKAI